MMLAENAAARARGWVTVSFSRPELVALWETATAFHRCKDIDSQQRKVSARSDVEIQFVGLKAEEALGWLLGVPVDHEVRPEGDRGYDLFYRGHTLQVKFTEHGDRDPWLSFFPGEFQSETAALIVRAPGEPLLAGAVSVCGWIGKARWDIERVEKNWGYGARWCVPWTTLRQFSLSKPGASALAGSSV